MKEYDQHLAIKREQKNLELSVHNEEVFRSEENRLTEKHCYGNCRECGCDHDHPQQSKDGP